ncbi:aspartate-alanine antiporter-like transporter [Helicovermis profundi]|uniref:Membrane protein n=1 Tax=Helicovermis profundi TaxID=3065157 RepID=A0AAU9EFB0_9FIRM|nr:membrane protein [Clostridia bacterium S502]
MSFSISGWITNPFVLMFFAVFTGLLFGKIKFGKFNFGISGTLFTGLIIGWFAMRYANSFSEGEKAFAVSSKLIKAGVVDKNFFYLFLILFVAAVGLLAAKDIGGVIKKYGVKFIILGFVITLIGAMTTYGMTKLTVNSNPYEISGVYTGALTSSPGLAAAIETAGGHATDWADNYASLDDKSKTKLLNILDTSGKLTIENTPSLSEDQKAKFINNAKAGVGVGHAIGYPFGVLIVILAMNFFPKIFRIDVRKEEEEYKKELEAVKNAKGKNEKEIEEVGFDLMAFAFACLMGYTLGKFKINLKFIGLGMFSLGSTGGVLIGSLILGHIGKIGFMHFRMNSKILGVIRQLALAFFLAVVGLRFGYKVFEALTGTGAFLALVALVVGVVAMMLGFFIGRYVFKINWIMLSGAICGGMTSTPGLGAAVEAIGSDDPAAGYGATYPFALLGMVIFTIILHNLPM